MKKCLQSLICIVTALHLVGGHWGMLQVVAWAGMLRTYTQEKGIVQGMKETFDGEHPCPMCCRLAAAREKEQKQTPAVPQKDLEKLIKWFSAAPETGVLAQRWSLDDVKVDFAPPSQPSAQWSIRPPSPPPRAA